MGKNSSKGVLPHVLLFLWFCFFSPITHVFIESTNYASSLDRFWQATEHLGGLEPSDFHDYDDDLIPFALIYAISASILALKTAAANFPAFSRSIYPLIPPPKTT